MVIIPSSRAMLSTLYKYIPIDIPPCWQFNMITVLNTDKIINAHIIFCLLTWGENNFFLSQTELINITTIITPPKNTSIKK